MAGAGLPCACPRRDLRPSPGALRAHGTLCPLPCVGSFLLSPQALTPQPHPPHPHLRCLQVGAGAYVERMRRLADAHGEQFAPPQIVVDLAKSGGKFHAKA